LKRNDYTRLLLSLALILTLRGTSASADDWPMWRHDSGRTAVSQQELPGRLALSWSRKLPALTPAFRSERLQFDAGYEPIVSGGLLIFGSSRNDSVTALDAATGEQRWQFFTDGPVRLAPVAWRDRVLVGSDDGCLYCLKLESGAMLWQHRAVPSERRLLGNQRLISVWPVRGGPVIAENRLYYAAGVWPFEGVFVFCADAETGETIWSNESLGYRFSQHPHGTQAIGGLAPQGYLVVNGDELIVPCSTAYPARLNRHTGELIEFDLPAPGRFPGGWFAALDAEDHKAVRRGTLKFDDVVNQQLHEDKVHKGDGTSGISRVIRVGDRELKFDVGLAGLNASGLSEAELSPSASKIHSLAASDGRLFVVTLDGTIRCFAAPDRIVESKPLRQADPVIVAGRDHAALVDRLAGRHGYGLGVGDQHLIDELLMRTKLNLVVVDPDSPAINRLRRRFNETGHYGERVAAFVSSFDALQLPPYFADVVVSETPDRLLAQLDASNMPQLLKVLRPFGGQLVLTTASAQQRALIEIVNSEPDSGLNVETLETQLAVTRVGALPGSSNYTGGWQHSPDANVRFPLGVLWFDDSLGHFKRSPQPQFVDGVMVSYPKDWHAPRIRGVYTVDYPLLAPVLSDAYTGRVFDDAEQTAVRKTLVETDPKTREPSQYRPPYQTDAWKPAQPRAGERVNPLTGLKEERVFPKTYGCDGGVDYGSLYSMRSGTAAFYDKTLESGTVFVSGPRSGCTNSIIPANGLLNLPYFYEGCTCSYPLPSGLALVAMPPQHEQWSSWGEGTPTQIQRIGINFGAPGDRMTREGTLWLDYPSVGGPSPTLEIVSEPVELRRRYRHSVWLKGGSGWSWTLASSVENLKTFTLSGLKSGRYLVRLSFAEMSNIEPGQRVQTVSLQGKPVLTDFDIVENANGPLRGIVREFKDVDVEASLQLSIEAATGTSLISGIELIHESLEPGEIPEISSVLAPE